MKYAACLNPQGRFSPTVIGDFIFNPGIGRHAWKGLVANDAAELATQVNGAMASLKSFGDPFQTVEVVEVKSEEEKKA